MELRNEDLALRPWTEDDVPALVVACNDVEITYWIPLIPSPYTEEDALSFVRGEVRPEEHSLAITLDGVVVGSIGMGVNSMNYRGRIGYMGRGVGTRTWRLHACAAAPRALGARRARASAAGSHHRPGQHGFSTCGREGGVPTGGSPARTSSPS